MAPPCYPLRGNGNGKQNYWQKGSTRGTMAPPTVYDLQQQMRQAQQANQRQMDQMTALLMGKGKGKSHDKGKGKGASHDKGKGKGKGSNNAWAKAYSPAGIQVRANNHAKAFFASEQVALDAELAKAVQLESAQAAAKVAPTQTLRREMLEVKPAMQEDNSQASKDAAEVAQQEAHAKTLQMMGLAPLPSVTNLDLLYPVPRATGVRKSAEAVVNGKLDGSSTASLDNAEALLDGCKAAVSLHKHSKNAAMKQGLLEELQAAQAALAKLQSAKPKANKAKLIIAEALDAVGPTESKRAEAAATMMENADRVHQQCLEALDAQVQGLAQMRQQMQDHRKQSQSQWQQLNLMLATEATQLKEELHKRLQEAEKAAPLAGTSAPVGALGDLQRKFLVTLEEVPSITEQPNPSYLEELASLHFFYTNVGDFAAVLPTTFEGMEVNPHVIHTIVGDRIWEGFWETENSKNIVKTQYIPTEMHQVIRHALRPKREQLAAMAGMEPARVRYEAAKTLADRVELGYAAY